MKERPILFSGPMVKAILDGRKTMTRRVVRDQESVEPMDDNPGQGNWVHRNTLHPCDYTCTQEPFDLCPYGKPGDRLWCKETFYAYGRFRLTGNRTKTGGPEMEFVEEDPPTLRHGIRYVYPAEAPQYPLTTPMYPTQRGWHKRPSIFMHRKASRITLEVTGVRVERLNDLSEADATAEGVEGLEVYPTNRGIFQRVWDKINGKKHPWASNPWAWVIEFKML